MTQPIPIRRSRPRVLAAFCGVGGDTAGYQAAGCHVTGIDAKPQPRYIGDAFHQGDAIEYIRAHGHEYDFIQAGPPCQFDCTLTAGTNAAKRHLYPDLLEPTRAALESTGRPAQRDRTQRLGLAGASRRMRNST